jgi:16S rRNA (guanine527-N7)-methyltransferase
MRGERMDRELEICLRSGAAKFGADLNNEMIRRLFEYKGLLLEWNEKMNLTAIKDDKEIILKHFVDSLTIVPYLKGTGSFIDVGTGAGFPGIPLKIALSHLDTVLLDSLEKRVGFLDTVISGLGLEGIKAVHMRAEDAGMSPEFRERFDAATARAVASLPVLLEYCLPFVKTGGVFIAMKGSSTQEISMSGKALEILGGEIEEVKEFTLPDTDIKRSIVIIRKLRQTPTKYPRKAGKPSKEPLL